MWRRESRGATGGGFLTPPPSWNTTRRVYVAMPMSERKRSSFIKNQESFRVPTGDSPYVRAKHAQLVSKDPDRAISLFWAAINAGDRVDSALKDMVVVLKQLDRSDEGIEAIKSFRYLCPFESQDSIDNLLLELYKKSGRITEEAELLEHKLRTLEQDTHYGGRIKIAKRIHGEQNNKTIEQEKARILGNLAWVHLQLHNYGIAEQYYRNALSLEPDNNKLCNLAICLIRMDRIPEAKPLLEDVRQSLGNQWKEELFRNSFERATDMLAERERATAADKPEDLLTSSSSDNFSSRCSGWMKGNKALAGTSTELGNIYKTSSHVSSESVEQNPYLITQPRECKWGDEEVNQSKWDATIGAARRPRFWTVGPARRLRFGNHYQKYLKRVGTAASTTDGEKLGQNLIDELHQFISSHSDCITSKARKLCADLIKEKEDNEKSSERIASESSSAYAKIVDIGQRSVHIGERKVRLIGRRSV
ncbi:Tetratricopeptide-like helical domain superfamily [Arabidopsis suecica]|uniref:Tetratricopeptide-like helical domain superfamily n=1 Tax=Arabidopsis suecica TaxID=45249 RepID=A0A8T1XNR7_ARASU|nr:Tetratricopeptide-like helical domain superfamily [Arabidopsis suecica]